MSGVFQRIFHVHRHGFSLAALLGAFGELTYDCSFSLSAVQFDLYKF
jgi:hypothetical protein